MQLNNNNKIILQVKDNQEYLLKDCIYNSHSRPVFDSYQEEATKKRNRIESRKVEVFNDDNTQKFSITDKEFKSYIRQIIKVTRYRSVFNTKNKKYEDSVEEAYYISTTYLKAKDYNKIIRNHWKIENSNHYVRDETFKEDKSRIRINPINMARIRSFAMNIMRFNKINNMSLELYRNTMDINRILGYKDVLEN